MIINPQDVTDWWFPSVQVLLFYLIKTGPSVTSNSLWQYSELYTRSWVSDFEHDSKCLWKKKKKWHTLDQIGVCRVQIRCQVISKLRILDQLCIRHWGLRTRVTMVPHYVVGQTHFVYSWYCSKKIFAYLLTQNYLLF